VQKLATNGKNIPQDRLFDRSSLRPGLTFNQIGRELGIDPETAAKYSALDAFPRRRATKRTSKLDAFKPAINFGQLINSTAPDPFQILPDHSNCFC